MTWSLILDNPSPRDSQQKEGRWYRPGLARQNGVNKDFWLISSNWRENVAPVRNQTHGENAQEALKKPAKLHVLAFAEQRFTMKTEAGAEVRVDAEKAFEDGFSPELVIGQAVSVYGDTDARGVVHAEVIKRARVPRKR